MKSISKMNQLFYYTVSSLLLIVIAVHCLKISGNRTVNGYRLKSKISYQFNTFTAGNNSFIPTGSGMKSTPYVYDLVLKKVIDGKVYIPNRMQVKASNIKKNLFLARLTIVTA